MISFTIITTTPVVLRNRLIERGIIKEEVVDGVTKLVGTRAGTEWVEVPNPVKASGTGTELDPYVPATQRCYLVKFAHTAKDDETAGEPQDDRSLLLRTKLGKWIMANSVAFTINSADGRSWPSRRVGTTLWVVDSPDFGVWQ